MPRYYLGMCSYLWRISGKLSKFLPHLITPFQDVPLSVLEPVVHADELLDPLFPHVVGQFLGLLPCQRTSLAEQTHFVLSKAFGNSSETQLTLHSSPPTEWSSELPRYSLQKAPSYSHFFCAIKKFCLITTVNLECGQESIS